jgi:hypothetical protein
MPKSQTKEPNMSTTMDAAHGTYEHGVGFGEGINSQSRTTWDLRPDNGGPPVKILMPVVDATQVVKNFPERYRYWWPSDVRPDRNPLTPAEVETLTHQGRIKKLQDQLSAAQDAFALIQANIAKQIELENSNRGNLT